MHQFARSGSIFFLAFAIVATILGTDRVVAQDAKSDEESRAGDPIKIEPYTGAPIFLDEGEERPEATFVSKVVDATKYANGKPRVEREIAKYSDDRLVAEGYYREFYPSGNKFTEGQFDKGRRIGEWNYWHDNGQVARTVNYEEGLLDGSWDVHNADGTVAAKRSFKGGKRDGVWTTFDKAGKQPLREEAYDGGMADGTWKVWFPNGQLQTEMNFKQGMRDGPTKVWDEKGAPRAEVSYEENVLEGTATLWGADGKKVTQHYEKGKLVREEKD